MRPPIPHVTAVLAEAEAAPGAEAHAAAITARAAEAAESAAVACETADAAETASAERRSDGADILCRGGAAPPRLLCVSSVFPLVGGLALSDRWTLQAKI
jgi:hypothetical protein